MSGPLKVEPGDRWGRWKVVRELPERRQVTGVPRRVFELECECGERAEHVLSAMYHARRVNGGCYPCGRARREAAKGWQKSAPAQLLVGECVPAADFARWTGRSGPPDFPRHRVTKQVFKGLMK